MQEILGAPERKLERARELLLEQQRRIDRQREWIAQLEDKTAQPLMLRPAKELLLQMIRTHEAMLRETHSAQTQVDGRLPRDVSEA
jgi:hypothetical protein